MINIERHIIKLLLSNDCVIVPDFGGFMAHHVDAYYNAEEGRFYPPQRTLGFNPQLTMNDSLLVQSFIEAYDVSYPEAVGMIEEEVNELRHELETNGEYEIYGLGTIALKEGGKYDFTPCESGILTPCLYGLDTFDIEKRKQEQPAIVVEAAESTKEEPNKSEQTTSIFEDNEADEDTRHISVPFWLLRDLAAACIAILIFLLLPTPAGDMKSALSGSKIDTSLLFKLMPQEVTKGKPTNLDIKKAAESSAQATDSVAPIADNEPYYTIVLASRITQSGAEAFVERLHKNKGMTSASVHCDNQGRKVIYGKYKSAQDARNDLHKLTDDCEFSDSWITRIN